MGGTIIIIGAGIAGLSAGCYGQMNGYETEVFEMHSAPGGVCTAWSRKGYTFDSCIHFLTGSGPTHPMYQMWDELGAIKGKSVINHDIFGRVVTPSGVSFTQYASLSRLAVEMKRIAPEDRKEIERLCRDARSFGELRMPLSSKKQSFFAKIKGLCKIAPKIPLFRRYASLTIEGLVTAFKSAELRQILRLIIPFEDFPALWLLSVLSLADKKEGGWPGGGSRVFAESIADRYRDLGGKVHYNARVDEIVTRDGRAIGVRLADGGIRTADRVISAADGHSTLFEMLKGKYLSDGLRKTYDTLPLYTPLVQVSFGVNRDLSKEPRLTTFAFAKPIAVGTNRVPWVLLNNYAFDSAMAPEGKSSVTLLFENPFEFWEKAHTDARGYKKEKERIARDAMTWLDSVYPGISADIEVIDVATPMTWIRYTANWKASYEGWRPSVKTMRTKIETTLPGLSGFSMIGQWTSSFAGLPTVAKDGRKVIEQFCEQDGRSFVTTRA